MTITFTRTAGQIIKGAMQDMRVLPIGDDPTSEEYTYGVERLNLMFKGLSAEGITPWTREEATATFATGASTVTLTPRPLDVLNASVVVTADYTRPLELWSEDEREMLPNRDTDGSPMAYTVIDNGVTVQMAVWPVPLEDTDVIYRYSRVLEDLTDENSSLDVPQVWLEGLQAMLAIRMPAFGQVPQDVAQAAAFHHRRLSDFARPESYTVEPTY
jgi:hypothetical protein